MLTFSKKSRIRAVVFFFPWIKEMEIIIET
jgi:hypothetical protein